jgi:hypothetical protein
VKFLSFTKETRAGKSSTGSICGLMDACWTRKQHVIQDLDKRACMHRYDELDKRACMHRYDELDKRACMHRYDELDKHACMHRYDELFILV